MHISELPNHDLSFIASYAQVEANSYSRKTDQVLNFFTNNSGVLKKIISYTTTSIALYASSVWEDANGNKAVLMDNDDAPFIMNINSGGDVLWQKGYAAIGRGQGRCCR